MMRIGRISLCLSATVEQHFSRRTIRIRRRLLGLEHLEVAYIVDVELRLEHNYDSLPVHPHCQNGCSKGHLTYGRVPLDSVSTCIAMAA